MFVAAYLRVRRSTSPCAAGREKRGMLVKVKVGVVDK